MIIKIIKNLKENENEFIRKIIYSERFNSFLNDY